MRGREPAFVQPDDPVHRLCEPFVVRRDQRGRAAVEECRDLDAGTVRNARACQRSGEFGVDTEHHAGDLGQHPVELVAATTHDQSEGVRASQVGEVALSRRHRRTRGERLALALDLLRDPAYDALFSGASAFAELPELMADLSTGRRAALCHTITYPTSDTDREI